MILREKATISSGGNRCFFAKYGDR